MEIRVGTRGSELAKAQTGLVVAALSNVSSGHDVTMEVLTTSGDKKQGLVGPSVTRDKRDWIAELEEAVVSGAIEIAIHSGKDCPVKLSEETVLVPVLSRASPHDAFISRYGESLDALPPGARVGTSSPRRRAQLLRLREDLDIVELRGNITTRLRRLTEEDVFDGIVLAESGIARLGLVTPTRHLIPVEQLVPAINQGILVAQVRRDRTDLLEILERIVDQPTRAAFRLERALADRLGGDCHSAIGNFAHVIGDKAKCIGEVLDPDTGETIREEREGQANEALIAELADGLIRRGAHEILARGGRS